jgi:hypothetical protein
MFLWTLSCIRKWCMKLMISCFFTQTVLFAAPRHLNGLSVENFPWANRDLGNWTSKALAGNWIIAKGPRRKRCNLLGLSGYKHSWRPVDSPAETSRFWVQNGYWLAYSHNREKPANRGFFILTPLYTNISSARNCAFVDQGSDIFSC